jgi:hypothetical protein
MFLIALTILTVESENILLECEYGDMYSTGYDCTVQNTELITSKDHRTISEVRGQHLSGKNNDDVKLFYSDYKKVNFLPRGVTKFFKNIDTVWITSGNLQEISKDDLKQFGGNLKHLWLSQNQIKIIEGDLFEFNPNLREISFHSNKIVHIDSGAFDGLQKLRSELNLYYNPCTRTLTSSINNPSEVIREVKKSCKDFTTTQLPETTTTYQTFTRKLTNPSSTIKTLEIEEKNSSFKSKLIEQKLENSALIQNLKETLEEILNQNDKIEEKISSLDSKLSALERKLTK